MDVTRAVESLFNTELIFDLYWSSSLWSRLIHSWLDILAIDPHCKSYEHGFVFLTMMYVAVGRGGNADTAESTSSVPPQSGT